jgi:hypothetical protein
MLRVSASYRNHLQQIAYGLLGVLTDISFSAQAKRASVLIE